GSISISGLYRFHCRFHDRQSFAGFLVLRQGLSLGEFIGSLWGVHVYARDFGKNAIVLASYPRKSCSLECEGVGFKLCNVISNNWIYFGEYLWNIHQIFYFSNFSTL